MMVMVLNAMKQCLKVLVSIGNYHRQLMLVVWMTQYRQSITRLPKVASVWILPNTQALIAQSALPMRLPVKVQLLLQPVMLSMWAKVPIANLLNASWEVPPMRIYVHPWFHLRFVRNATVNYLIVQQAGSGGEHLARLSVTLHENATLNVFVLNAGGKLVRQEIRVAVNGENSNLAMRGVNLVGNGAHIDVTTVLEHNVPNTNATELFRNVVAGDGKGVFQGQIKVAQAAQKTDAQMACNTLLLTDDSDFSAKPELEIFADDVICAHGATVTDIDDGHLFYLRARGIPERAARALLIKAFVDEVVEELDAGDLGETLIGLIDNWLDENI